MTSTLALLGFLTLTFLLVHRALIACQGQDSRFQKRQCRPRELANGKTNQGAEMPPEESDTLVPARQV